MRIQEGVRRVAGYITKLCYIGKGGTGQKEDVVAPKYQTLDGDKDDWRVETQH